jgi:drug/metabolite transporter (DMT)-like permease
MDRHSTSATTPHPPQNAYTGYTLAGLSAVLFSTKAILIKLAYGVNAAGTGVEVDAITLLALRMAFSAPVFVLIGAFAWRRRERHGLPTPSTRTIAMTAFVGLLGYYVSSYLDFAGLTHLTAQFERLILMTYPAFVMLLGAMFYGVPVTWASAAGLAVAYAGVAAIFVHGASAKGDHVALGVALVASASFTFAIYQLLAKSLLKEIDAPIFTCVAMTSASVGVAAHFVAVKGLDALLGASSRVVFLAALMAVFSTVAPTFMLNIALQRVGPQAVSMMGTIGPMATVGMAVAIIGEPFTFMDAFGSTLVMAGVGWFTWSDGRKRLVS